MHYYMHEQLRHVVTLEDAEKPEDCLPDRGQGYVPVHLHIGPGPGVRIPSKIARRLGAAFAIAIPTFLVLLLGGLAALAWKTVLG